MVPVPPEASSIAVGRFGRRTALGFSLAVSVTVSAPLVWFATRPTELLLGLVGA